MSRHNQAPQPGNPNVITKAKAAIALGILALGIGVGIVRNSGAANTENGPRTTMTTQQLASRFDDLYIVSDKHQPDVEVAEGFTPNQGPQSYFVSTDHGKDWTPLTNVGNGNLVHVEFAHNDEFGFTGDDLVAVTTIDRQSGELTLGVDVVTQSGVTAVGEQTVNDANTQALAHDFGVVSPGVTSTVGYGEYHTQGGVATRATHVTETFDTKGGDFSVDVRLGGEPVIPGTEV